MLWNHTFIYGRHVTIQMTINPSKWYNTSPYMHPTPHLQRMLLQIQKYDYTVYYLPGKEMILADILSRIFSRKKLTHTATHTHWLHTPVQQLLKHHMRICRKRPHQQPSLLAHSGCLACKISPSTLNSLTVLESPGWIINWWWNSPKRPIAVHPPYIHDRCLSNLDEGHIRIEKNATQCSIIYILAQHKCPYHWVHQAISRMHST